MPARGWRRTDRSRSERFQAYELTVGHLHLYVEYFDTEGQGWYASVDAYPARLLWQSKGYAYAKRATAERAAVRNARRLLERALAELELEP